MCLQPNSTQLPAWIKGSEAENPTNPGENRTWKQQPDTHLWAVFILIAKCRWVQGRAVLAVELFPGKALWLQGFGAARSNPGSRPRPHKI